MNPEDFARKHLQPYKIRGNEVVPTYCPFCRGNGKDKYSFALNLETGAYNCKRGTCSVSGNFHQLKKEFGEISMEFMPIKEEKTYKKPKTIPKTPTQKAEEYLRLRGFSPDTWTKRKVGESNGKIVFPYYENGQAVLMKFREPVKKGSWTREPEGKDVFWGMDEVKGDNLIITEGEFDTLALVEAGIDNAVSIPSGAEGLSCVEDCWDWLDGFKRVYIWPDNDVPGREMCKKLVKKLGEYRCYIISTEHKDANECLYKEGVRGVIKAVNSAKEVPISGIIRMADVKPMDVKSLDRVSTGFQKLDKILGGAFMGFLTVWTGENSSGKSTILGQVLAEAVNNDYKVCAFSGELPAPMFRYWMDLQIAGPGNLESYFDDFQGELAYFVPESITDKIRDWYRHKFFLHENYGAASEDEILEKFRYANMRYNCKVFLVDNLMTTIFNTSEKDFYRQQSNFIGRLCEFAKKHECHIHVVAHPRKTQGRLSKMDIAGSGEITNRADNVVAVHRIKEEERANLDEKFRDCSAIIDVFKNRLLGKQDVYFGLDFEPTSKRFYCPTNGGKDKKYGWEG